MHADVYMFPGQGSQYKGMGEELFNNFPLETKEASEILGYDIKQLALQDEQDKLNYTLYTQPIIYFLSCLSYLEERKKVNSSSFVVCGHSLGEYAACFAAGIFDLFTGLKIVKKRAELMSEIKNGTMMAVIGTDSLKTETLLEYINLDNIDIATFNSHKQIVLSGLSNEIVEAEKLLEIQGFKCILLNVSGAFHSRQMEGVRIEFMRFLKDYEFSLPIIPIISSTTAMPLEYDFILENLGFQLVKSVKWLQTILYLQSLSLTVFKELGPGNMLTKLNEEIFKNNATL
ncbi:acyltransferase domain-containing protein [Candidatus Cardinium hertigii]|uniref:Malonyl CoA-acyl carrier protein transacylase n=1 Tax=Candidatus Cardinium hertigii TaxID=247481 RepID=A0A2Z3LBF5_9BACT|nr:acyltransferase domain-containing protein [Candidatus Cardinium hertigii]AWN81562.1 Polyketide biosynthesis malonyl CoA-acyl carrier protein transacylase PksC [Candidatus Cardinium hertigii]